MKLISRTWQQDRRYERTRHNAGFMAVDLFALEKRGGEFSGGA